MGVIPPGNHTGRDDDGFPYYVCPYCNASERTFSTSDTEDDAKRALIFHIASHHPEKV